MGTSTIKTNTIGSTGITLECGSQPKFKTIESSLVLLSAIYCSLCIVWISQSTLKVKFGETIFLVQK